MRSFFTWMAVGALAGAVISTLVAPWVLETLLASTGAQDAMCQCTELVKNTATLLIKTQLWGAGSGAVVVPIAALLIKRSWGNRGTGPAQAPTSSP